MMSEATGILRERLAGVELGEEIVLERQPGFWDGFDLEEVKKRRARYGGGGFNDAVDAMLLDTLDDTLFDGPAPDEGEWTSQWLEALGRVAIKDQWSLKERVRLWNELLKCYIQKDRFGLIMGVYANNMNKWVSERVLERFTGGFGADFKEGLAKSSLRPGSDAHDRYDIKMPKKHTIGSEIGQVLDAVLALPESKKRQEAMLGVVMSGQRLYTNMRNAPSLEYRRNSWKRWLAVAQEVAKYGRPDMALDLVWHVRDMVRYSYDGAENNPTQQVHRIAGELISGYPNCPTQHRKEMREYIIGNGRWEDKLIGGVLEKMRSHIARENQDAEFKQTLDKALEAIKKPEKALAEINFAEYEGRQLILSWELVWIGIEEGELQKDSQLVERWERFRDFEPADDIGRWVRYSGIISSEIPKAAYPDLASKMMNLWSESYEQTYQDSYPFGVYQESLSVETADSLLGCVKNLAQQGKSGWVLERLNAAIGLNVEWYARKLKIGFGEKDWDDDGFERNAKMADTVLGAILRDINKQGVVDGMEEAVQRQKAVGGCLGRMLEAKESRDSALRRMEEVKETFGSQKLGKQVDSVAKKLNRLLVEQVRQELSELSECGQSEPLKR